MRDRKIKSILTKIIWLELLVQEFVSMDKYYDKQIPISVKTNLSLIGLLKEKLNIGRRLTKSDMGKCNEILKDMKRKYKFNIDWRGDIVDCELYIKFIMNQER